MEIAKLGEFGLIRRLTESIAPTQSSTLKGVGDDCAVIAPTDGEVTLVTTDMLMEGVHFDLIYTPLKHLGYKAVAVNLSDLYAMNATPRQLTVSLAIGKRFQVEDIDALYEGMRLACEKYGVDIVGGDTTASMTGLAISITAIGTARKEDIVCRNGAKETDSCWSARRRCICSRHARAAATPMCPSNPTSPDANTSSSASSSPSPGATSSHD